MKKLLIILFIALSVQTFGQLKGVVSSQSVGAASSYTVEYQAILNAMTVDPTGDTLTWQNAMVYSLDSAGFWERMDVLYIFANRNKQGGLLNWKAPTGDDNATDGATTVFTKYEGFTGDGAADYIETNFNPSSEGVNYTKDDASIGVYIRTNIDENLTVFGGTADFTDYIRFRPRVSDLVLLRLNTNSGGATAGANSDSDGFYVTSRIINNSAQVYRNGSEIDSEGSTTTNIPNCTIWILAENGIGAYATQQVSIFYVMDGCADATEADKIYDIFQRYMTRIGKQI